MSWSNSSHNNPHWFCDLLYQSFVTIISKSFWSTFSASYLRGSISQSFIRAKTSQSKLRNCIIQCCTLHLFGGSSVGFKLTMDLDDINATIRDIEARLAPGTTSPPEHSTPRQSKQGTPRLSLDSGFATLRHDKEHLRADDLGTTFSSQKEPSSRRKSVQLEPRDQTEPDEHMYDLSKLSERIH